MNIVPTILAVGILAVAGFFQPASAQAFPTKPIRLVVPFAGGGHDAIARVYADALSAELRQPVVVENKPGANGNIGAEAIANAAPDGYTLGLLSAFHPVNAAFYRQIRFDLAKDFTPLGFLGEAPVIFAAHPKAPYGNLVELLRYAQAHPGKINFGSSTNYPMELLIMRTGANIVNVPFRGVNEAITNVVGGNIDLTVGPASVLLPMIKDGRLKPIAIASTQRLTDLPGVATVAETVPGYDAGIWYGLFVPSATPPELVTRLRAALSAASARPEVVQKVRLQGVDGRLQKAEPRQVGERIQQEIARWKGVVAATGNYLN